MGFAPVIWQFAAHWSAWAAIGAATAVWAIVAFAAWMVRQKV